MAILISGVTGALGQQVARHCIDAGLPIIGLYRNKEKLERLDLPNKESMRFIPLELKDVRSKSDCQDIVADDLDHVVFCHGTYISKQFSEVTIDDLHHMLHIHFTSTFFICQYVLDSWSHLPEKDRSITYISSVATKTGSAHEIAYHASKRAGEAIMLSIARDYAKHAIRANIISPGLMNTPMGQRTIAQRPDILKRLPLGRTVDVIEVARLCETLMQSPSITGQMIHINAGRYSSI